MTAMKSRVSQHVMILPKITIDMKDILNSHTERCSHLRNLSIQLDPANWT